jgi:hypothetical protein
MSVWTAKKVQVYRRADGGFAYKPDGAPLQAAEMLIGRGFDAAEALELIEEFNAASIGARRPTRAGADGRA